MEDKEVREIEGMATNSMVSRRGFLQGLTLGAVGVAASASLSACDSNEPQGSSTASEEGTTSAVVVDGIDEAAIANIPPVEPPASWDYETEIVIVGGGGSGLCAAAAAAVKNGKKVIIIERLDRTGGQAQHAGAAAAFNTQVAVRGGAVWNDEVRAKCIAAGRAQSGYTIDIKSLKLLSTAHMRSTTGLKPRVGITG